MTTVPMAMCILWYNYIGCDIMFFRKKSKNNPDYESTLKNSGVNSFDKNISLLVISDTHGDLALNKEMQKK